MFGVAAVLNFQKIAQGKGQVVAAEYIKQKIEQVTVRQYQRFLITDMAGQVVNQRLVG